MAISLFTDQTEEAYFYDLLAARKLKEKRYERENYEKEIEVALEKCGKILTENGARYNFIAEIDNAANNLANEEDADALLVKQILDNSPREMSDFRSPASLKEDLLAKKEALTEEFARFIETLSRQVREDLEFLSRQIVDRRARCATNLADEEAIVNYYPNAKIIDYNETFGVLRDLFNGITSFIKTEPLIVIQKQKSKAVRESKNKEVSGQTGLELDSKNEIKKVKEEQTPEPAQVIDITEHLNRRKVIKIKKASPTLLDNINPKRKYVEEIAAPITEADNSFFTPVDTTLSQEIFNPFDIGDLNAPLPELDNAEAIKLDPIVAINSPFSEEAITIETSEPVIQSESLETDNFAFEMPIGMSLSVLAEALYDDASRWMDIYSANKELIDNTLAEKEYANLNKMENDANVLAGLKIEIPVLEKEANAELKKAT